MRSVSMLFGLAMLLTLAVSLPGQTSGEIAGEVRDPSGSVIAGADVKAVNKGTGAERATVTNDAGLYNFSVLQPGVYDVTVTKSGFQSMARTDLQLQVQQVARVDFALQIGQTTQVVEVTGAADHRERHRRIGDRKQAHRGIAAQRPQFPATSLADPKCYCRVCRLQRCR